MRPSCHLFVCMLGALILGNAFLPHASFAEEGGSGHYLPGSMASFVDGVPAGPTFLLRYNLFNYAGSFGRDKPLPIAGITAQNLNVDSWAHGLTAVWCPNWDLGNKWSYAMSTTVPYVFMEVTADVDPVGGKTDKENGLGDIVLMPLMLNFNANSNLNANARIAIYAPTGDYEIGRLANMGKNYWSVEPTLALMYFGLGNGIEASWFGGMTFNAENPDTDYKTGTQLHSDATVAQHFPVGKGLAGVGLNAAWYQQITGDSGAGATFGDFEGMTYGLGPVLSYTRTVKMIDLIAELKWLHELETRNRVQGDYIWLKVICKF